MASKIQLSFWCIMCRSEGFITIPEDEEPQEDRVVQCEDLELREAASQQRKDVIAHERPNKDNPRRHPQPPTLPRLHGAIDAPRVDDEEHGHGHDRKRRPDGEEEEDASCDLGIEHPEVHGPQ